MRAAVDSIKGEFLNILNDGVQYRDERLAVLAEIVRELPNESMSGSHEVA